jgi:hypothetical protein
MCARIAGFLVVAAIALLTTRTAQAAPVRGDKNDKEVTKLIKQLGAADAVTRKKAARRLEEIGSPALLALHEAAKSKDAEVKKAAEQVMAAIGEKGQMLVADRLNKIDPNAGATVRQVDNMSLARLFPGHLFYAVIMRQYPIARQPAKPLQMQNIFIADQKGTLKQLTNNKELLAFFRANLQPAKVEDAMKEVTRAWLGLGAEFHQDGLFLFSVPKKDDVKVRAEGNAKQATGQATIAPKGGNGGAVQVTLTFDAAGELVKFSEKAEIRRGIRPICQATKLLDPDPIVRRMAEKDILVMGRAAKAYLDEQRAKARPELKKVIDRLWQRIIAEGW